MPRCQCRCTSCSWSPRCASESAVHNLMMAQLSLGMRLDHAQSAHWRLMRASKDEASLDRSFASNHGMAPGNRECLDRKPRPVPTGSAMYSKEQCERVICCLSTGMMHDVTRIQQETVAPCHRMAGSRRRGKATKGVRHSCNIAGTLHLLTEVSVKASMCPPQHGCCRKGQLPARICTGHGERRCHCRLRCSCAAAGHPEARRAVRCLLHTQLTCSPFLSYPG